MKFEKLYTIKKDKWTAWNETLSDAIDDFYKVYTTLIPQPNCISFRYTAYYPIFNFTEFGEVP